MNRNTNMTEAPLHVRGDFECGNVALLDVPGDGPRPEVHFAASPKGGPEAMWFYFRIEPVAGRPAPDRVRCVLHNLPSLLGGGHHAKAFHPAYKTGAHPWRRVEAAEVSTRADGRPLIAWDVPGNEGPIDVALCYPYGLDQLAALEADLAGAFARDIIGVTQGDRPLPRLSNMPGEAGGITPGVYCMARQHAGETPGSWVLDGFLRQMAEVKHAPLVWAAPMVDIDGVVAGYYGKDRDPWDFNRAWGSKRFPKELHAERGTHPMRHEVRCIQDDMDHWRSRCRPMVVLDFHAPAVQENSGIYCYLRHVDEDGQPDAAHRPWIDAFREAVGDPLAAERFARSGKYPSRWERARVGDFVTEALGLPAVTFEVAYGSAKDRILTLDDYQQIGRRVAQAVADVSAGAGKPGA